jgi:hypothetical protein
MALFSARLPAVQVLTVASASLSAIYYSSQSPTFAVEILGYVLNPAAIGLAITAFALDLVKPEMMRVAGSAGYGFLRRSCATFIFAVLFVASMIAVDGVMARLRSDWAAGRGNAISAYADAKKIVAELEREIELLKNPRPVKVIQAEVEAMKIDMAIWRRSAQCSDISRDDTKEACAPVLELYKERGAAARKAELDPQLTAARTRLMGIEPPKAADPQAEAIAKASGLTETTVSYLMIAILGLAIETVTCFGIWIFQSPKPKTMTIANQSAVVKGPSAGLEKLTSAIIANGGHLQAENAELASFLGVTEGCASKWRKAWRTAGEIVEEKADGRITFTLGRKRLRAVA